MSDPSIGGTQQPSADGSGVPCPADVPPTPPEDPDSSPSAQPSPSSDVPQQAPPPPHIVIAISQLAADNLEGAFRRIAEDIQSFINESSIAERYNFLFLYDEQSRISERTSNKLYGAASSDFRDRTKPTLLLLHTRGGSVVPAYLISRYLKVSSGPGFIVSVPRRAKSAGTLLALGASEIHMGMMSELGPVDPQFRNLPALGLGSGLDYIAGVAEKHPGASEMLAKYLQSSVSVHHLGLYERVSESATHYAQRLLERNGLGEQETREVAHQLVYGYKDHSFAIDCDEIKRILGGDIVKIETPEYRLANRIHQYMEQVNLGYGLFHQKYCSVIGRADGLSLLQLEED